MNRRPPLQNRVTPFGDIVATEGRGLFMGNRGLLHDARQRVVRFSQVKRWIICRLEFRGRRRRVMSPDSYTELFFLDEAAALAAGHRPCAECRHADYTRFRNTWAAAHGDAPPAADAMDVRLHAERLVAPRTKRTYRARMSTLPDGVYLDIDGAAWLRWMDGVHRWSAAGYLERRRRPRGIVTVLTPPSTVAVIAAGYRPSVHLSVGGAGRQGHSD